MTADTRKDKRASVQLKVRFKSATVDEFIEQYAVDISRGGIFIKSKQPMAIGTLLKFEFQLKDESRLIHGVGRVVWKREDAPGLDADHPAGMGVKFIKMDPESKATVDRIVAARGDAAGAYEAGGGDHPEAGGAAASVRPAKATMAFDAAALGPPKEGAFFPTTSTPDQMPPPEDRTQVRHASEFLASALGAAGEDVEAAAEAERKAAEARKRSEDIERQRAREAASKREREEQERADAEQRAADERAAESERAAAKATAAKAKAAEPQPAAKKEATPTPGPLPKAARIPSADASAASSKGRDVRGSDRPAAARVPSVPPAAPRPEPRSNVGIIIGAVVVLAGAGYAGWYFFLGGNGSGATTIAQGDDAGATEAEDAGTMIAENAADAGATTAEVSADSGATAAVVADAGATTHVVTAEQDSGALPAAPVNVRIESTPSGATILVDGEAKGTTPASVSLPANATATVTLRLAGYDDGTVHVQVGHSAQPPVRVTLQSIPYAIVVDTTPAGARVSANGHTIVSPGTILLGARPRGAVTVTATKPGFDQTHATVLVPEYTLEEGQMRRHLTISLTVHTGPVVTHPPGGGRPDGGEAGGEHPPPGGGEHPPPGGGEHPPPGGGEHPPPGGTEIPDNPFG